MAVKEFKMPGTLAQVADLLYKTREKRLKVQKDAVVLEDQEKQMRAHLIDNLPKSEATGVSGKIANAKIVTKTEPTVEDWDALYKYISRTKSFDMLQRRLSGEAVKERWAAKKVIPGVGTFNVVTVSVTKVG